jgi:hypothetical protein
MARRCAKRDNPWEILVIGALYLLPGLGLLLQKKPALLVNQGGRTWIRAFLLSPAEAHFFGYCAVAVGALLTVLYFYLRSVIAREERASPPRFLESKK